MHKIVCDGCLVGVMYLYLLRDSSCQQVLLLEQQSVRSTIYCHNISIVHSVKSMCYMKFETLGDDYFTCHTCSLMLQCHLQ